MAIYRRDYHNKGVPRSSRPVDRATDREPMQPRITVMGDGRLTERAQGHRELPIAAGNTVGLEEIPGDTDSGPCAPGIGRLDNASICRPRPFRACLCDNSGIRGADAAAVSG